MSAEKLKDVRRGLPDQRTIQADQRVLDIVLRNETLLNGLDDIALTMQRKSQIETFETRRSEVWPWLDGFGYKGKIAVPAVRAPKKKMDW